MILPFSLRAAASTLALAAGLSTVPAYGSTLIPRDAEWRFFKGNAAPSSPGSAWRGGGFDDGGWPAGDAPFRYGDGSGGTLLDDMRDSYTTVFLRRAFNVTSVDLVSRLELAVDYDDGFAVWINGTLALAQNAPADPAFDSVATGLHESGAFETFVLPNHETYLVEGRNVIAIQVLNVSASSSDLMMNPELTSVAPDLDPPTVVGFDPPPGIVPGLPQVTVTFSEPVTGVDAGDLVLNETPATSVTGSADRWIFTFPTVPSGPVTARWSMDHAIRDTASPPNPFDGSVPSEVRLYTIVDLDPPVVSALFPPPGATLRELSRLTLTFSEPVAGVQASDLLVGGNPTASVTGSGAGPYEFSFPQATPGAVEVRWAGGHGIVDLAADPNPFAGGSWTYAVDPDSPPANVVLNEIMASNRGGRVDQDGEASDWIELRNFGATAVNLAGWSLSDDPAVPDQWVFPERTLPAGGYLIIFASGKDRRPAGGGELHANFKLSASGEYLGLFGPELPRRVVDELAPEFPIQRTDHSYGRTAAGTWAYFPSPSPASVNPSASALAGLLEPPHVNTPRGFYSRAFQLSLTAPDPDAEIWFTTDGSEPSPLNGVRYAAPIPVSRTTILRAAAFRDGFLPSETVTHSYLYGLSAAQRSLPVVSLVTDNANLFGPTGIMETNPRNTTNRGIAWERPTSAEILHPNQGGEDIQVDCGLRVQGGDYVRGRYDPNGGLPFSKYSFRLYFRGDYGPTTLRYPFFPGSPVQEFDRIVLRAGMNDHSNPFIVDELVRRLTIDTGQVGSRGTFVNLFINGEYQGYYNPAERIDNDFLASWHGGGNEWDVIAQFGEVREGDATEWNRMRSLVVGPDLSDPANYQTATEVLDVDNFIDYIMVNIYAGTGDWPHNNWRAARQRKPGAKFRFYVWDAEWSFGNAGRSVTTNNITGELSAGSDIANIFQSLLASPEFRLRFADRVQLHFFNGGALTDENVRSRYEAMRGEMAAVLPGMNTYIGTTWVPQRRAIVMDQLASADLQRSDNAPVLSPASGPVPPGFQLTMSAPGGTIYYTLDGSDPREPVTADGGGVSRTLVRESDPKRALVPSAANGGSGIGTSWTGGSEPFNDGAWTAGTGGMGYDESPDYAPHIQIDLNGEMNDTNGSAYMRIPFNVQAGDLDGMNFMQLRMKFDDGFVAYLNGIRIASANAPASPSWDSLATGNNADAAAMNFRGFNVSDFLGELRVGANVLAIHGLNDGLGSSDFLISAELEVGERIDGGVADSAIAYGGPVVLGQLPAVVRARTYRNGAWSALVEGVFDAGSSPLPLRITEVMYNPDGGSAYEFIELRNTGSRAVDLGHATFDGIGFRFAPGSIIQPGESLVLASNDDPEAFATRYPQVVVAGAFTGNLSNSGETIVLRDGLGNPLASVSYGDDRGWPPDADGTGRSLVLVDPEGDPDDPTNWRASTEAGGSPGLGDPPPSGAASARIAEVLAHNLGAAAHNGEFPDFVEIGNPTAATIDLSGFGLTDEPDVPTRFSFPAGTNLAPGGQVVVWCGASAPGAGLRAGFALDRDGESLFLSAPDGTVVDAVTFGRQVADLSISRTGPDGAWRLTPPSPGSANLAPTATAPAASLVINEWMADPLPGEDDWLELHNTHATLPAALRGLVLSAGDSSHRYGPLAFLEARGHLRLWADEKPGTNHLGFRLPAGGATLALAAPSGEAIGTPIAYGPQIEDASAGRLPDGSDTIVSFPNAASPGAPNYTTSNPGVVINEVLVAGADDSAGWVEIRNTSGAPLGVDGFSLGIGSRESGRWMFPSGLSVPAGQFLIVACDGSRPASSTAIDLNTGRSLRPGGDTVFLFDAAGREIDRIRFGPGVQGLSIGRDSQSRWSLLTSPTSGGPNAASASLASSSGLRINEWLANAADGQDDFVELYNPNPQPADIGGLKLTDDLSITGDTIRSLPPLSFVPGSGFLALIADGSTAGGADHLPFALDAFGETLRLSTSTNTLIDEITWGLEMPGISSGRLPDGSATFSSLPTPSPGASNAFDPATVDSDGDGMPDAWEEDFGLDPRDPSDAETDLDHDGHPNLAEFIANTNPTRNAGRFEITGIEPTDSGIALTFIARSGVAYEVESTRSLTSNDWHAAASIASSDITRVLTVRIDARDAASRFYRIVARRR